MAVEHESCYVLTVRNDKPRRPTDTGRLTDLVQAEKIRSAAKLTAYDMTAAERRVTLTDFKAWLTEMGFELRPVYERYDQSQFRVLTNGPTDDVRIKFAWWQ
jgi:hypothetical protein